jgi:hypothetical protein
MTYDINLTQGDSDNVDFILKADGVGVNIAGADVIFAMRNDLGTVEHDITCLPGVKTPPSDGGGIIPFTFVETEIPGLYFAKVVVTLQGVQTTFPSSGYLTVKIEKAL